MSSPWKGLDGDGPCSHPKMKRRLNPVVSSGDVEIEVKMLWLVLGND